MGVPIFGSSYLRTILGRAERVDGLSFSPGTRRVSATMIVQGMRRTRAYIVGLSFLPPLVLFSASVFAQRPQFVDQTLSAGVDYLQYLTREPPFCLFGGGYDCTPADMSGGAAVGDVNGDGWPDLYVTRLEQQDILFLNEGDGTFTDGTLDAGLTLVVNSNGAGFADIDNDGDQDLYLTTLGEAQFYLFINDGFGSFSEEALDRGAAVATPLERFGFSVAFGDYDRDGFLDLYTTEWNNRSVSCVGSATRLLHNLGAEAPGFFEDVTAHAGVALENSGEPQSFGFAPAFVDLDNDDWLDLAVVADFGSSRLFWNNRDGTFSDGTVAAQVGTESSGMGSTFGDFDGDGLLDWFVTAIHRGAEPNSGNRLYRNKGDRSFDDVTDAVGVRAGDWGWGAVALDYDNDGDRDLAMTNGVVWSSRFDDDPTVFWENDNGLMTEVTAEVGITDRGNGKGILTFDYDGDGDLDLFIVNSGGHPVLLRNDGGNDQAWLRVVVEGGLSNRDGYGAVAWVLPSGSAPSQIAVVGASSHFLGQSERVLHFGLGTETNAVAELRVRWPGGTEAVLNDVPLNSTIKVVEPIGTMLEPRLVGHGMADCDQDGVADACGIELNVSADCNQDGVPDRCQLEGNDCNANRIPDACDLTLLDCNRDGVVDACQPSIADCDSNGVPDSCDIWNGFDCDGNSVPDACDLADRSLDCDQNGALDRCQIVWSPESDCDGDGQVDACQLTAAPELDCHADGVLDVCQPELGCGTSAAPDGGPIEVPPTGDEAPPGGDASPSSDFGPGDGNDLLGGPRASDCRSSPPAVWALLMGLWFRARRARKRRNH